MSFAGGAATGALICFALLKEKYEALANEEIKNMKDYYQKEMENIDDEYEKELDNLIHTMNRDIEEHNKREEKETYVDYVKKYSPEEIIKDKYYDIPYPDVIDEDDGPPEDPPENDLQYEEPFVISREEFDEGYPHFDKITITYYENDDVLADEQDEVIPDIDAVVGYDSLGRFGDMSEDDCVVYVRNGRLGADYEIVLAQESYTESVLGIVQDKVLPSHVLVSHKQPHSHDVHIPKHNH